MRRPSATAVLSLLLAAGCATTGDRTPPETTPGPEETAAAAAAPGMQAPAGTARRVVRRPSRFGRSAAQGPQLADGPAFIDLSMVPHDLLDSRHQPAEGEPGRIESPLPEEIQELLREAAKLLPPSANVSRPAPAGPESAAPFFSISFDSLDEGDCCGGGDNVPPDPEIAVGPNHIIVGVNVAFAIYNKSGVRLSGPTTFEGFFSGVGGGDCTRLFDPNILYDEDKNRFVIGVASDDLSAGSGYCVAASQGPNPTGFWWGYRVPTNTNGRFFDFPQAGVGRDAIYVGSNQFSTKFEEGRLFALNKTQMYAGAAMTFVTRSMGSDSTPQPVHLHGALVGTWPASGPQYIVTDLFDGSNVAVWEWQDPFGTNVLTKKGTLNLATATGVTPGFPIDVPQAGSIAKLQANDWRPLDAEYRNGSIWTTQTIACNPGGNPVDCVRWARIDPTVPSIVSAGVFADPGQYRFFPDIAANHCNDMAVGYSKSSSSIFPGAYITGREMGVTLSESTVKAGAAAYTAFDSSPHRWGDYTGMTIDPDGEVFWYVGEYSKPNALGAGEWGNFVGSFRYPSCVAPGTWHPFFAVDSRETPFVGDFNADLKTDIITFTRDNPLAVGDVYVSLSDGTRFGTSKKWHDFFAIDSGEKVIIGDYDGDGDDDIATWLGPERALGPTFQIYVALSFGTGMCGSNLWLSNFGNSIEDQIFSGDVDMDGDDDLILFDRSSVNGFGEVWVALSNGFAGACANSSDPSPGSFQAPQKWQSFFAVSPNERPRVGDVDGDGCTDIITFATDSPTAFGDVYVAKSNCTSSFEVSPSKWHDFFGINPAELLRIGRFGSDLRDDFFTFLPQTGGQVYVSESLGNAMGPNFLYQNGGFSPGPTSQIFVGDATGDGKADIIHFQQDLGRVRVKVTP